MVPLASTCLSPPLPLSLTQVVVPVQTMPAMRDFDGDMLVLSGDVPLLTDKTARALLGYHRTTNASATILTAELDDPAGYGRIVNVASVAGKEGNPMAAAYSASKAAVIGMTKSVGKDVAGTGVLVNCLCPAPIDTPMVRGLSEEHVQYMLSRVPMGRLASTDEAARAIAYLASDGMTFSTGAAFDLSGGRLTY